MKKTSQRHQMAVVGWLVSGLLSNFGSALADANLTDSVGRSQQLTSLEQVPDGLSASDWRSIREAYEAGRYAFQPTTTGWQARNPAQNWVTTFDRRGFLAQPQTGNWEWGLELTSYGFGDAQHVIAGPPVARAEGSRLSYQWDDTVQEWFVNDQRGLEHGFTLAARPVSHAQSSLHDPYLGLSLLLATRGALRPNNSSDGLGVEYRDATGAPVLTYTGLKVWDADGTLLPSHFAALDPEHPARITLTVEEHSARYPITIDPIAYLKPAAVGTTQVGDEFGYSVAVSGDTVVVGARLEDSSTTGVDSVADENASGSGAAYVFFRMGSTWSQQAYLKPAAVGTTQLGDQFGYSVAVSGDTVVVGARNEDSSTTGVDSVADESAGNSGAAYVFFRTGSTWSQQAYLKPASIGTTQAGDQFGWSVAVSDDTVVVGAWLEDSSTTGVDSVADESAGNAGAAYVFFRTGSTWSQQAYLKPAAVGTSQVGEQFGYSVAVSGDTVVVGASNENSSTTGVDSVADESAGSSGAAYVFSRTGSTWSQQAYLKAAFVGTTQVGDEFGFSVAVSGDTVVVGAIREDSSTTGIDSIADEGANDSGAAYVFFRVGSTWSQQAYLKPAAVGITQAGDEFGQSVAVSGDTVVVGAWLEDSGTTGLNTVADESAFSSGAAYVFFRTGSTWSQQIYLKPPAVGIAQTSDHFGFSVAVSDGTMVVGARFEDSSTTGVDGGADENANDSGAAYVFSSCDNGLFCDGIEFFDGFECQAGTPPACDDAAFCNGTETCNESTDSCDAGTPPTCDDAVFCNGTETCNESTDSCDAGTPPTCDDAVFCNGTETCNESTDSCDAGTPPTCDDGVGCTDDACDEGTDSCDHTANDSGCDNGFFCDGDETCDAVNDCQAGTLPVCVDFGCDEVNDVCFECNVDNDCDDGLFCTGSETCTSGSCDATGDPCPGQYCDEDADSCAAAQLFEDGFESGDTSFWSSTVGGA